MRAFFKFFIFLTFFLSLFFFCEKKKEEIPSPPLTVLKQVHNNLKSYSLDLEFFNALQKLEKYIDENPNAKDANEAIFLLFKTKIDTITLAPLKGKKFIEESEKISFLQKEQEKLKKFGAVKEEKIQNLISLYEIARILLSTEDEKRKELYDLIEKIKGEKSLEESLSLLLLSYYNKHLLSTIPLLEAERELYILKNFEHLLVTSERTFPYSYFTKIIGNYTELLKTQAQKDDGLKEGIEKLKAEGIKNFQNRIFPLPLPYIPVSLRGEEEKEVTPVIEENMGEGNLRCNVYPLEEVTIGEKTVWLGLRPLFSLKGESYAFVDNEFGYSFPGVAVFPPHDVEKIKEVEEKGKIDKIEELLNRLEELNIAELEKKAFLEKTQKGLLNFERQNDKSILLLVDIRAKVEIIKAVLKTLKSVNYKRFLFVRGNNPSSVIPVYYQSTEGIDEKFLKNQPRRPLIVHLKIKSIDIYPPLGAMEKLEGEIPKWDKSVKVFLEKKNVFKVSIPYHENIVEILKSSIERIEKTQGISPFVHFVIEDGVDSGLLLKSLGIISSFEGKEIKDIEEINPQLVCVEGKTPCISRIPVVFSKIAIPTMEKEKPEEQILVERPAGFCDKKQIARVVKSRSGAYKACYELVLQKEPNLQGKIEIMWIIELDGTPSKITVIKDTLKNKIVLDCLLKQIKSLKFDKPEGGICVVRWPFKFSPRE